MTLHHTPRTYSSNMYICNDILYILKIYWSSLVQSPTYLVLDHESSFGPHLSHKVVDIKIIFLLESLHHCINSNECASSAHTSTVKEHIEQKT